MEFIQQHKHNMHIELLMSISSIFDKLGTPLSFSTTSRQAVCYTSIHFPDSAQCFIQRFFTQN
jgi:hypothetical protein